MVLSLATISGRITDLLGSSGVRATIELQPRTSVGPFLPDPNGNLRVGPEPLDTAPDGSASITIPRLPQAGFEDYHWFVKITPLDRDRPPLSGTFDLTGDMSWRQVADFFVSGAPVDVPVLTQAITARQGAETARDAAAASASAAAAIGTTNDTLIAGRINTTGSATRNALNTVISAAITGIGAGNVTSSQLSTATSGVLAQVPSLEEQILVAGPRWRASVAPNGVTVDLPAASAHATVLVAPFPLTILSANIEWTNGQAANAADYWTMTLRKANAGVTTGSDIAAIVTSGGVAAMTPTDWASLNDANRKLLTGQRLIIAAGRSSTASPNLGGATVTLRYART